MLTNREQQCATWIVEGKTSWEIAQILGISENTVNFHIKNIMRKLRCNTRALVVARLIRADVGSAAREGIDGLPGRDRAIGLKSAATMEISAPAIRVAARRNSSWRNS